ncbi:hypothetical protein EJ06DRAFT_581081 [Trichodelitschia bisporula]|uniref:Uncharacterized protein n=1 Tax=Trichodelitschia bisporula TaxID=703511 RepID=A0A6G1I0L4_9PEZI|nr:hypothetical protein EJ06DRAFT_581081 [Trichodelitschia bisporula]
MSRIDRLRMPPPALSHLLTTSRLDDPSDQLHNDIHDALTRALPTRRPILHHLESGWLLQIPRPLAATRRGGRVYYNVLVNLGLERQCLKEKWWFGWRRTAEERHKEDIEVIKEGVWGIEELAGGESDGRGDAWLDAVVVGCDIDNTYHEVLTKLGREVPVFAIDAALERIQSWLYFHTVTAIPPMAGPRFDWKTTSQLPLPDWLGISHAICETEQPKTHPSIIITFGTAPLPPSGEVRARPRRSNGPFPYDSPEPEPLAECVVFATPEVTAAALIPIDQAIPPIHTLCLVQEFRDWAGRGLRSHMGTSNILQVRQLDPKISNNIQTQQPDLETLSTTQLHQSDRKALHGFQAQQVLKPKYLIGLKDDIKKDGFAWIFRHMPWAAFGGVLQSGRADSKEVSSPSLAKDLQEQDRPNRGSGTHNTYMQCVNSKYEELRHGISKLLE